MRKSILVFIILCITGFCLYGQSKPIVQDIQAQTGNGSKINVFWTLPQNSKPAITKLLLYRDTRPITSYAQVKKLQPIAELSAETTGYTDNIRDFNDYFYCVISYTNQPYDLVLISMNTTVTGVHLTPVSTYTKILPPEKEEKLYLEGEMRETPLPYINYVEGVKTEQQISQDLAASMSQFYSRSYGEEKLINPYFFEEDLISPDGGDDFLLFEILKTTFVQEKYSEAIVELQKLTNRNINQKVQNRAYFYMAEAQFFTGRYDDAIRSFLLVQQAYPQETKKWINLSLDSLTIPQ